MPQSMTWALPAALAIGYLLGSIPFGLLLTRLFGGTDIRTVGSGNIGATNVLRTGRRDLAAATLVADALKGTVAVLVGSRLAADGAMIAGLGAVVGHIFPIWLGFRGGKGVATYVGVLAALSWPAALLFGAVWLATAFGTRYSSLAGLTASLMTPPALVFLFGQPRIGGLFVLLTVILWLRHGENIRRLLAGRESRIGGKE